MKKTILDTSTITDLAKMNFSHLIKHDPYIHNYNLYRSASIGIEAMVLYETILYDSFSVMGMLNRDYLGEDINENILIRLKELSAFFVPMEESQSSVIEIYSGIIDLFQKCLQSDFEWTKYDDLYEYYLRDYDSVPAKYRHSRETIIDFDSQKSIISELGVHPFQVYDFWKSSKKLESFVPTDLSRKLKKCVEIFSEKSIDKYYRNMWSLSFPILRIFYYQVLQKKYNSNFVPHLIKARMIEDSNDYTVSKSILNFFDSEVKTKFEQKKKDMFGIRKVIFEVPLLASYILAGTREWKEFLDKVMVLKNSKEAKNFRNAIKVLNNLLSKKDNFAIDKIINELNAAAQIWQEKLSIGIKKTKKINVSIPLVGVSTEFDVPIQKLTIDTSDDILVFIHKLLERG